MKDGLRSWAKLHDYRGESVDIVQERQEKDDKQMKLAGRVALLWPG